MIRAYSDQFPSEWDAATPFLMFAVRDSVNESTGFTPFELVDGHEVRGPLRLLKERQVGGQPPEDTLEYAARFTDQFQVACKVAQQNLEVSKGYIRNNTIRGRSF